VKKQVKYFIFQKLHLTVLQRMFVMLGCLMLVVCIVFFSIFNYVYRRNIREIVADEMQSNLNRINEYINLIITNSASVSNALMNNSTLQLILSQQYLARTPIHVKPEFRAFYNLFIDISSANKFISSTDIYIQPQHLFLMSDLTATYWLNPAVIRYLDEITNTDGDLWVSTEYEDKVCRQFLRTTDTLSIIRPLFSLYSGKKMGFISINVHTAALQRILQTVQGSECVILDDENRLVVDMQVSQDGTSLFENGKFALLLPNTNSATFQKFYNREFIIVSSTIESVGWRLVSFTPTDMLIHKGISLQGYLIAMNVVMIIFIFAAMTMILRQVTKRIRSLVNMMDSLKGGDFQLDFREQDKDEFSYLLFSFNSMIENVKSMFSEIYHLELMHKDVQLRLLQNQVNPHFLYNIFNNMHWLVKLGRYNDLDALISSASVFYSRSLNDGKQSISMYDTVEKLNSYVKIQQIRFQDRFAFNLSFDDDLMEIEILNHLIQPLLENAIIHGVEPVSGMRRIVVTGRIYSSNVITICVSDDGAGIPKEKLKAIKQSLLNEEIQGEFFAINNVHHRIQMFYGKEYGLSIESEERIGTTVTILLPYLTSNNQGVDNCV